VFTNHIGRSCLCFGLALMTAILATGVRADAGDATKYTAYAEDSLQMSVWVTVSESDSAAPILLLLPMMAHSHESYDPLIQALATYVAQDSGNGCAQELPYFISFDLRGHGLSTIRGQDTLSFRTMKEPEFAKYPGDVVQAMEFAWSQVDEEAGDMVVVGASIGANTAMMLTEMLPRVSKVVLLSPGEDYRGLKPAEALKMFKGNALIFACEDDQYSATSSRKLAALNEKRCTLHIFNGSDHGTDIINNNPEAMRILVDWLCAP